MVSFTKDKRDLVDVSVVIPYLHQSQYLFQAINSVLSQSILPREIILVKNGTFFSAEKKFFVNILEKNNCREVKLKIAHQEIPGSGPTRNLGVNISNSSLIAFLDSDDSWDPEKLEKQVAMHKSQCLILSGTRARYRNSYGITIGESLKFKNSNSYEDNFAQNKLLPFVLSSWIINKKLFQQMGGFDQKYKFAQDYEFMYRIWDLGFEIKLLNEILVTYVQNKEAVSTKNHVDQYLMANFSRLPGEKTKLEMETYLVKHKSLIYKVFRNALSGYLIRQFNSKRRHKFSVRSLLLIPALILSPSNFYQKFYNHVLKTGFSDTKFFSARKMHGGS